MRSAKKRVLAEHYSYVRAGLMFVLNARSVHEQWDNEQTISRTSLHWRHCASWLRDQWCDGCGFPTFEPFVGNLRTSAETSWRHCVVTSSHVRRTLWVLSTRTHIKTNFA